MDDPNITMEEYIRLEEEKARRRGKVYNWENFMYGKIWYDEDIHNLRYVETEFPAIFFNDAIISVDDLKMDSENDNDKVNMPSFSSPKPTVSYFNDLDFFKDFENEFPAIVYYDALTSKSDSSTEPVEIPHHIDEFDLKTETSLSECDEDLAGKEIDNVGGVFIFWKYRCVKVLRDLRWLFNTFLLMKSTMENLPSKTSG
ncbi:hypothetical protein Tco_1058459 [Tanacetum coccineum]|uniref:Uncharacterized protein n=1 Tax=Tanacetum coccineum TaxID=301880 RepID=A0ABQ5HA35_9ASTR